MIRRFFGTLTLIAVVIVITPRSTSAAVYECQGHAATIVGREGAAVYGTAGDDVFVVSVIGAEVSAGDGNDLVCLRDGLEEGSPTGGLGSSIDLMSGDDVLVNESSRQPTLSIDPGEGAATIIGGPAHETVGRRVRLHLPRH